MLINTNSTHKRVHHENIRSVSTRLVNNFSLMSVDGESKEEL
jgi:hypothetical protein